MAEDESPEHIAVTEAVDRFVDGATFIFDAPEDIPALWGHDGGQVLWPSGEGLMIAGPQGVGKSTIVQQLVLHRVGVRAGSFLGLPVALAERPVLYLAMDRPQQIARSFRRMVEPDDRSQIAQRLIVWRGPLPFNIVKEPHALADFAESHGVGDVVVDSYKDLAPGLVQDEVGAQVNIAVQEVIARGMQWVGLHHQRKANGDNKRPDRLDDVYGSGWLTAGLGSVALLWAKPGSAAVELNHLKQPAEPVGPLSLKHRHAEGRSSVTDQEHDLMSLLLGKGDVGLTVVEAAEALFGLADTAEKKKAARRLDDLVGQNLARSEAGGKGGSGGGGTAKRWFAK